MRTDRFFAAVNFVGMLYFAQRLHDVRHFGSSGQVFGFFLFWALAIFTAYQVLDYLVKEFKNV